MKVYVCSCATIWGLCTKFCSEILRSAKFCPHQISPFQIAHVPNPPPPLDAPGQRHGQQPVSGTADPGVVKQDKSSRGSVDTTKTRSGPQRVRMSSSERPIGAAKGKQSNTEALCQPPPPPTLGSCAPACWRVVLRHRTPDYLPFPPLKPLLSTLDSHSSHRTRGCRRATTCCLRCTATPTCPSRPCRV